MIETSHALDGKKHKWQQKIRGKATTRHVHSLTPPICLASHGVVIREGGGQTSPRQIPRLGDLSSLEQE